MHFSKASTYGIRAVAYMASHNERSAVPVREISERLQIPAAFLTKVMQRLASAGIVQTTRGYGGGVTLSRPAYEITLKQVIQAIEGEGAFEQYWLGIAREHMLQIPEFHNKWQQLNRSLDHFFATTHMDELSVDKGGRSRERSGDGRISVL